MSFMKDRANLKNYIASHDSVTPEPILTSIKLNKTPRYYQTNAVHTAIDYLSVGFRRLLYVSPTGTGKTLLSKLTATSIQLREIFGINQKIRENPDYKVRVLFIAGQQRLLRQAIEEFRECDDIELIAHSAFKDVSDNVIENGWDLTFIDEAHHEAMTSIQRLLDVVKDRPIFGLTATPDRGDGLLLKFERFIYPITKEQAIRRKFIATPSINSIVDTSGSNKLAIAKEVIDLYYDEMGQTIVYFKTQKECQDFLSYCQEKGYEAFWLQGDSKMDDVLEDFSNGVFKLLLNCQKLGEGVDIQNCTDVLLARQFKSKGEKEQYVGRAIRPDSSCTVWEFINPFKDNIPTKTLFSVVRYHRLIYKRHGEWSEKFIERNEDSEIYDHEFLSMEANAV